jgi:hypothetical protein
MDQRRARVTTFGTDTDTDTDTISMADREEQPLKEEWLPDGYVKVCFFLIIKPYCGIVKLTPTHVKCILLISTSEERIIERQREICD